MTIVYRHLNPFLGPMYGWVATLPGGAAVTLPVATKLALKWIASRLEVMPAVETRKKLFIAGERFRADAKAEGDDVVVGGGALSPVSSDRMDAAWFSETLTKQNAPWAFSKGEAFKTIAAQELSASLLCLKLLVCGCDFDCDVTLSLTGGTDNQGNTAVVTKLMTTTFPLSLILMEVAACMHDKGLALRLDWLPRELNVPADDLTNWKFAKFDPLERVLLGWDNPGWLVLSDLMDASAELFAMLANN